MMRVRYTNPNYDPREDTMWQEAKYRLMHCKNFLKFAWLALWFNSRTVSIVFFNMVREEGDSLIADIEDNWDFKAVIEDTHAE